MTQRHMRRWRWASSGLVILVLAVSALPARATCLLTCVDADAGDDPAHFGVVTVETSCAAPGGPVTRTRTDYYDACEAGALTEYFCGPYGQPLKRVATCRRCDPLRRGVCYRSGPAGAEESAGAPTQSCTTVTGDGPDPTPSPTGD